MPVMRIRYKQLGGHYHCQVFTATTLDATFAKNGDLIFDEHEWPDVKYILRGAELLDDTPAEGVPT